MVIDKTPTTASISYKPATASLGQYAKVETGELIEGVRLSLVVDVVSFEFTTERLSDLEHFNTVHCVA